MPHAFWHVVLPVEATLDSVLLHLVMLSVPLLRDMADCIPKVRITHLIVGVPQVLIMMGLTFKSVLVAAPSRISRHFQLLCFWPDWPDSPP